VQKQFSDWHAESLNEPEVFNRSLMEYLIWYNTEKPHRGIGKLPPIRYYLERFVSPQQSNMLWTLTMDCAEMRAVLKSAYLKRLHSLRQKGVTLFKKLMNANFERIANFLLMLLMGIVAALSIADLTLTIYLEILSTPFFLVKVERLQYLLGLFFWIIIALEVFSTIRAYIRHHHFYVERIMLAGVVAITRKIIVLDLHEVNGLTIIGIATVLVVLCAGYYFIRRTPPRTAKEEKQFEEESGEIKIKEKIQEKV
jgi:uncharacterized membrane protein (DUF373 family)